MRDHWKTVQLIFGIWVLSWLEWVIKKKHVLDCRFSLHQSGCASVCVNSMKIISLHARTVSLLWFRHNIYYYIFAVIRFKRRMLNEINDDVELQRPEILLSTVFRSWPIRPNKENNVNSSEQWHCNMECKNHSFKDRNSSDKRFISPTIRPGITWISFCVKCELCRKMCLFFCFFIGGGVYFWDQWIAHEWMASDVSLCA